MSPQGGKPLDFNDPQRYLNSEKQQEKTSPRDYILANRQILTHQIVNQEKKDYLDQIQKQFQQKQENLV